MKILFDQDIVDREKAVEALQGWLAYASHGNTYKYRISLVKLFNRLFPFKKRDKIKEEIADIFIYLIKISNKLDLDIEKIINQKIDKNEKKYPVEKSKGNSLKYTEFDE